MISPRLIYLDPIEGQIRPLRKGFPGLGRVLVLPHSRYTHARRHLERTDSVGRIAAEKLAKFDSSFPSPRVLVDVAPQKLAGAPSSIWTWNEVQEGDADRIALPSLPEPLCRQPLAQGCRIVEGLEGWDGEIWRHNKLIASRWWPKPPLKDDWIQFVRSSGIRSWPQDFGFSEAMKMPSTESPSWRHDLILGGTDWQQRLGNVRPKAVATLIAAIAIGAISLELGQIGSIRSELSEAQDTLKTRTAAAESWLSLRREALRTRSSIDSLRPPGESIAIVFALSDLSSELDKVGLTVTDISLTDNRMTISLARPGLENPADMIATLEESASWNNVSYDGARQKIVGDIEFNRHRGAS